VTASRRGRSWVQPRAVLGLAGARRDVVSYP